MINLSPLDAGNNTQKSGYFPDGKVQVDVNNAPGSVFRSFCQEGDEFCAGAFPLGHDIHASEQATHKKAAIEFMKQLKL